MEKRISPEELARLVSSTNLYLAGAALFEDELKVVLLRPDEAQKRFWGIPMVYSRVREPLHPIVLRIKCVKEWLNTSMEEISYPSVSEVHYDTDRIELCCCEGRQLMVVVEKLCLFLEERTDVVGSVVQEAFFWLFSERLVLDISELSGVQLQ